MALTVNSFGAIVKPIQVNWRTPARQIFVESTDGVVTVQSLIGATANNYLQIYNIVAYITGTASYFSLYSNTDEMLKVAVPTGESIVIPFGNFPLCTREGEALQFSKGHSSMDVFLSIIYRDGTLQ